jgi:hypothetical protein
MKHSFFATISVSCLKKDPFPLHCSDELAKRLEAAKKRVEKMDETDGCEIGHHHIDMALRTIMHALLAGLSAEHATDCLEDALIMIQQLEHTVRKCAKFVDNVNLATSHKRN